MTTSQQQINELSKENIENIFGLAPMQRGMLVHYAKDPDTTAYVEQFDFSLSGPADETRFEQALNLVIEKYAVLRTIFSYRKTDEPRQVILKQRYAALEVQDFSASANVSEIESEVEAWKNREKARGFDLSQDLLLRTALITTGENQHRLIVTFHHIILDGWCLGLVFGDLFAFYEALGEHTADALRAGSELTSNLSPELTLREPHQYASFIKWLSEQDEAKGHEYWQTTLADYEAEVGIPWFDCTVSDTPDAPDTQNHIFTLDETVSSAIDAIAKQHEITFNSVFQAAWGVLLQKYNDTRDAVFGAVVSGRPAALPGVENMVGLFINTQPVRVTSQADDSFISVAKAVNQQLIQSNQYDFMALQDVQKQSSLGNKLLNHVLAFENYPVAERMKNIASSDDPNVLSVNDVQVYEQTNYDFNVIVNPGACTKINFIYNAARFSASQMAALQRSFETLLATVINEPNVTVSSVSICSDTEKNTVFQRFNNTQVPYPDDKTILDLFEETVAQYPDSVALIGEKQAGENQRYTYAELRQHARNMAQTLIAKQVKPGDLVAILLPRSTNTIIALLAVQYAGATWLPLDIKAPADRVAYTLENAECLTAITLGEFAKTMPEQICCVLAEEQIQEQAQAPAPLQEPAQPFPASLTPHSPAYVMYTSGSTGKPKGCTVTHQNIVRLVRNTNYCTLDDKQVIMATCSPVFDVSTFEYWGALLNGGKLCMYDDNVILNADQMKAIMQAEQVNTMWLTSALFNQLVDTDLTLFAHLEQLLVGGDVVSLVHTRKVLEAYPSVKIINGYGPTENTTFSSTYHIAEPSDFRLPIGKPINNSTCYVLDDQLNMLPPGAFGELCVGGDGVALGYVKRPDLNEKMFLANPFEPGKRLYRTGDIVRWLPDGNLDLQGRKDFQHKIRGFRIELGEIEWNLTRIDGVSEAIVMVKEDDNAAKQLHAWFVSDSPDTDEKKVRQKLLQQLPGYMVPGFMMRLEKFPLSASGKVDRHTLRDMQAKKMSNDNIVAPRNDAERDIAAIFQQVLGLDQISVFDNFFDVGADSINLITINNRLNKALNQNISTTVMFEHTSIAQLAQYLNPDEERQKQQQQDEAASLSNARNKLMKSRRLQREMDE